MAVRLVHIWKITLLLAADTLHRFCKKEHDWGWKKFMELSKVLEGFTVANTLVIKAQVQVIRYVQGTCLPKYLAAVLQFSYSNNDTAS